MCAAPAGAGEGAATPPFPAAAVPARPSASSATHVRTRRNRATGGGILRGVGGGTRGQLPAGGGGRCEVVVNGGPQRAGQGFRREGGAPGVERPLAREGRRG